MPTPYPISGIVYDVDGSTGLANAKVIIQNLRTLDRASTTTASDGSYAFDLANEADFPNGYVDGDDLIFYAVKVISAKAEKYAQDTGVVSGTGLTKNLTVILYIDKDIYPLPGLSGKDNIFRVFEPTSRALRVIPTADNGTTYMLFAKRTGTTTWDLVLPNSTKFGEVDADGNFKISGEFSALQSF